MRTNRSPKNASSSRCNQDAVRRASTPHCQMSLNTTTEHESKHHYRQEQDLFYESSGMVQIKGKELDSVSRESCKEAPQ
jgi:hypothetical protein